MLQIEADLQLNRRPKQRCYDGLLIVAWTLQHWPDKLHHLVRELRVAEPHRQLELWKPMPKNIYLDLMRLIGG